MVLVIVAFISTDEHTAFRRTGLWLAGVIELARRRARRRRLLVVLVLVAAAAAGWSAGSLGTGPVVHSGLSGAPSGLQALQLRPGQAVEINAVDVIRLPWPTVMSTGHGGFAGNSRPVRGFVSYRQDIRLTTAYDGFGSAEIRASAPAFVGAAAAHRLWEVAYRKNPARWRLERSASVRRGQHTLYFAGHTVTYGQLLALPRDGHALRRLIRAYCRKSGADPITQIDLLLTETVLPPGQRASIITAALGLPGVSLEHGVREPLGRTGDALATRFVSPAPEFRGRAVVAQLIFDPATFAVLAEQSVVPGAAKIAGVPADFRPGWRAYTTSRVMPTRAP